MLKGRYTFVNQTICVWFANQTFVITDVVCKPYMMVGRQLVRNQNLSALCEHKGMFVHSVDVFLNRIYVHKQYTIMFDCATKCLFSIHQGANHRVIQIKCPKRLNAKTNDSEEKKKHNSEDVLQEILQQMFELTVRILNTGLCAFDGIINDALQHQNEILSISHTIFAFKSSRVVSSGNYTRSLGIPIRSSRVDLDLETEEATNQMK